MQAKSCERDVKRLSWFATCDRKKASSQSEGFARLSASSSSGSGALIVLSQFSPTSSRFIFKFMPDISIGVQKMDILYKEEDKIKKLRQTDTQTEWTYLGMGRHEEDCVLSLTGH